MKDIFSPRHPLVLVGCGHMGRALASGWLKAGLRPEALYMVDPAVDAAIFPQVPAGNFAASLDQIQRGLEAGTVILAVKPQVIDTVLAQLQVITGEDTLVVSIAAGVSLAQMARGTAGDAALVRAMPNTPAAVGAGITGLTASAGISEQQKQLARDLLSATGDTVWVENEELMDMVTAVSGSGPAYVFHLVECMAAAGMKGGLSQEVAMRLARQTVIGSAHLMDVEKNITAAELRRRVTSPGGTTAAALEILTQEDGGMADLMQKAVLAARKRGEDLAG